jgi:hypothetical protein
MAIPGVQVTLRTARMFEKMSEQQVSRFDKEMAKFVSRFAALSDLNGTSNQHEEATRALGEALGFASSRPDNEFHTGPDVLWIDEEEKCCLLFELKTLQQGAKPLTKKIVGQGHDHIQWVKNEHPNLKIVGILFIAESVDCNSDANPSSEMHVGSLSTLKDEAANFIVQMKAIRSALPVERMIKVSTYATDDENNLDGLKQRIASVCLNNEI